MTRYLYPKPPLAGTGVVATQPPNYLTFDRRPTSNDINYRIGTFWLYQPIDNSAAEELYNLVSVASNSAEWIQLNSSQDKFTPDTGGIVSGDNNGNINIYGSTHGALSGITIVGSPEDNSLHLAWGADGVVSAPLDKMILTGVTSGQPTFLNFTSQDETVVITQTADAIDLSAVTGGNVGVVSLEGDSGGSVLSDAGNLFVKGGTSSGLTVAGNSLTNTLSLEYPTPGTNGQVLIGGTGITPKFANLTSLDSSVVFTTGANTLDLSANNYPAQTTLRYKFGPFNISYTSPKIYNFGTGVVMTEDWDTTVDSFFPGDGNTDAAEFEAPDSGLYYVSCAGAFSQTPPTGTGNYSFTVLVTSNNPDVAPPVMSIPFYGTSFSGGTSRNYNPAITAGGLVYMNGGDTLAFQLQIAGGVPSTTATMQINGSVTIAFLGMLPAR